jgi:type I restriction enzyme S subunit
LKYVYYFFSQEGIREQIRSQAGGSSQPIFNFTTLKNFEIELPSISDQKKVVAILSAYDDLIENNLKRIKILEEMAQMIYREWFVNFRFPEHEKVKMVKSELGMIPEGWEVVKSSDCIEINPSTRVDKKKPKPYVDMGGLSESSMIIESKEFRTCNNGAKYRNGDTLFARITPCLENGKTGFAQFLEEGEVGLGSTEFIVFRSKSLSPEFVYLLARTDEFRNNAIKSMTGASGRQRVQIECFDKYFLPQPDKIVLHKFAEVVRPIFQGIYRLDLKNKNLRKTRDLLLPKLISGEIDVESLDNSQQWVIK